MLLKRILAFALLMTFAAFAFSCGDGNSGIYTGPKNEDPLSGTSNERNTYAPGTPAREPRGKLPNGVRLFGFGDVNALGAEAVKGIEKTFSIADKEYPGGQRKGLDYYGLVFYEPHPACNSGTPGFLVRGMATVTFDPDTGLPSKNYDGTEYDKDPRNGWYAICAVGKYSIREVTTAGKQDRYYQLSLVNAGDVATWAQYETEHAVLWDLDQKRFGETSGAGKESHPIFAQPGSAVTLRSVPDVVQ